MYLGKLSNLNSWEPKKYSMFPCSRITRSGSWMWARHMYPPWDKAFFGIFSKHSTAVGPSARTRKLMSLATSRPPASKSTAITAEFPPSTAKINGVLFLCSASASPPTLRFTSAFSSMRCLAFSARPYSASTCRGVLPYSSNLPGSALAARRRDAHSALLPVCKGVVFFFSVYSFVDVCSGLKQQRYSCCFAVSSRRKERCPKQTSFGTFCHLPSHKFNFFGIAVGAEGIGLFDQIQLPLLKLLSEREHSWAERWTYNWEDHWFWKNHCYSSCSSCSLILHSLGRGTVVCSCEPLPNNKIPTTMFPFASSDSGCAKPIPVISAWGDEVKHGWPSHK